MGLLRNLDIVIAIAVLAGSTGAILHYLPQAQSVESQSSQSNLADFSKLLVQQVELAKNQTEDKSKGESK